MTDNLGPCLMTSTGATKHGKYLLDHSARIIVPNA